jgi:hypothetical protein
VTKCAPTVSLAARWYIYAFVMPRPPSACDLHVVHVQSGSMGEKSSAKEACRRLSTPFGVIALPKRCVGLEAAYSMEEGKYVPQSSSATRSRTYLRLGLQTQPDLLGSQHP